MRQTACSMGVHYIRILQWGFAGLKQIRFSVFKVISEIVLMALFFAATFFFMQYNALFSFMPDDLRIRAYCAISIIYCFCLWLLLAVFEGLGVGKRRILDLVFGFFFSCVCVNAGYGVLLLLFARLSFGFVFLHAFLFVVLQSFTGLLWILVNHRVYEHVQFAKEAVYIFGKKDDAQEINRINSTINRYFKFSRVLDSSQGLESILPQIEDFSVVYLGDVPTDERNAILKYCMKKKIDCYSIPKISDIYIQNSRVMQLNDKLLLKYPPLEIDRGHSAFKRAFDIIVAAVLLVVSSPLMLAIALAVKLTDGGPVIYKQDRVTMNGKEFTMYKFRSMKVDAEKDGPRMAAVDDERVTAVGRIIRNLHFDELPQLVNVLKGEMSLVGPRPERKEFIEEYSRVIPEFSQRLRVKGGLTGYAQVYGRYNTTPEDKIKYDLYYIYNYSPWLDLKIIILTIRILFQKENTQGVEQGQVNALKKCDAIMETVQEENPSRGKKTGNIRQKPEAGGIFENTASTFGETMP